MVHLRIVVPADRCGKVLDLLEASPSTSNLVFLAGAARQPKGDVVLGAASLGIALGVGQVCFAAALVWDPLR